MRKAKAPLIVVALLMLANSAFACLSASQNRMFPIGSSEQGLLVLETHLQRTEFFDPHTKRKGMEPAWHGFAYLKTYDPHFNVLSTVLLDTVRLFQQDQYVSTINTFHKRASQLAQEHPGFTPAAPSSIHFCGYTEQCTQARISSDNVANAPYITLLNKKRYEISALMDTSTIASQLIQQLNGYDTNEIESINYKGKIFISSIRQFIIGKSKLTIVHLGTGQFFELDDGGMYPPGKEEHQATLPFTDINNSVYDEPVLHHGHGFDFAIWE